MKGLLNIFVIFVLVVVGASYATTAAHAQNNNNPDVELVVTDEEKIILFSGFAVAVLAVFMFLARDIILRRKTSYDKKEELESKKDKTFEKYHSDWGDDYEEMGQRRNTKEDKEFREASNNDRLPNYYEIIGVPEDATPDEIKKRFREQAKKMHPDKTKADSIDAMAELNKAYEVLSDKQSKERYDTYFKAS